MTDGMDMLVSGGMGFVFRHVAELTKAARANNIQDHELLEKSMQKASSRGGTWIRRAFMLLCVFSLVSVIIAGFMDKTVILEYELNRSILGLIKWDAVKQVPVEGVVFIKENRTIIIRMLSFYLGQGVK